MVGHCRTIRETLTRLSVKLFLDRPLGLGDCLTCFLDLPPELVVLVLFPFIDAPPALSRFLGEKAAARSNLSRPGWRVV
jgi:hypothetical protein